MDAIRASFRIFQATPAPLAGADRLDSGPQRAAEGVAALQQRATASARPLESSEAGGQPRNSPDSRSREGPMDDEAARLRELWSRDMTVRASQAHTAPDGKFQGLPSFEYSIGSDGRVYATGDPPPSYIDETAIEAAVIAARPTDEDAKPEAAKIAPGSVAEDQADAAAAVADTPTPSRRVTRLFGSREEAAGVAPGRTEAAAQAESPARAGVSGVEQQGDDERAQREVVHAYHQLDESPPKERSFEVIA